MINTCIHTYIHTYIYIQIRIPSHSLPATQNNAAPLQLQPLLADIRNDLEWSAIFDELDRVVQVNVLESMLNVCSKYALLKGCFLRIMCSSTDFLRFLL